MTGLKGHSDATATVLRIGNLVVKSVNVTIDILASTVVKVYTCNGKLSATVTLINDVSGVSPKNTGTSTNMKYTHPALPV